MQDRARGLGRSSILLCVMALPLAAYVLSHLLGPEPLAPAVHWAALAILALAVTIAILPRRSLEQSNPSATGETIEGYKATVRALAAALDASDPFTLGRSYRLSRFCVRVGRHLGLSDGALDNLEYSALLHDIGKAAIKSEILLKPGKLSDEERASLATHPEIAYEIMREIPQLALAAEIIRAHHEQPDGKGYPRGLAGTQIPIGSRIIMVVAAFDAMTSDRPYRRGLLHQEAYQELRAGIGRMFFPEVVEALIELHGSGALFDDFDLDKLEMYSSGEVGSRVVESYLRAHGRIPGAGATKAGSRKGDEAEGELVLEMPVESQLPDRSRPKPGDRGSSAAA